jgi:glycosyltransferase involved in cell wall biosynthesis
VPLTRLLCGANLFSVKSSLGGRLVVPVYNERDLVDEVSKTLEEAIRKSPSLRVVVVDDGSKDGTGIAFRERLRLFDNAEVIILPKNGGKGHAVLNGFRDAEEENLIFMDGDMAYSVNHLPLLLESLKKHDVVIGSRSMAPQAQRGLPAMRAFLGWGFNRFARWLLRIDYSDTQAGLKGFKRKAAEKLFQRQKLSGFAFDVELLYLCRKLGLSVGQVPAQVSSQHTYKTSRVKLFCDSLKCFKELLLIRWWSWTGAYPPHE